MTGAAVTGERVEYHGGAAAREKAARLGRAG